MRGTDIGGIKMNKKTIWKELSSNFTFSKHDQRKLRYFRWKNGIDTNRYAYSKMSKEDFMKNLKLTDTEFYNLEKWESTPEYKRLLCLLKEDGFANDIIEVYEQVKKKALDGDSQAIKNMLLLQKEIAKYRKSIDEFFETEEQAETEEDDGLII